MIDYTKRIKYIYMTILPSEGYSEGYIVLNVDREGDVFSKVVFLPEKVNLPKVLRNWLLVKD